MIPILNRTHQTRWILPLCLLAFSPISAQTNTSYYRPGVTTEGAVYFLPKTAVKVTVQVEKATYTPGELCRYSERYLRIKDVSPESSVSYRITAIRQEAVAVADTTKRYAVKFDARTSACNVVLSDDGILRAVNTEEKVTGNRPADGQQIKASSQKPLPSPHQYLSEEMLAAGSTAKMAELIAQDIYEIRESRNLLVRGQADYMPKDGEQLRLMLSQLELHDRVLTSMFTGTTVKDTAEYCFTVIPDKTISRDILFRFSQKLGLVDSDDLSGAPYYISIEDLGTAPKPEPVDPKKMQKSVPGIYVNIPGRLRSTVADMEKTFVTDEFPAGQFGNVELLSGALFNKRYTTRLLLHPISGAVEKLEAEQPK